MRPLSTSWPHRKLHQANMQPHSSTASQRSKLYNQPQHPTCMNCAKAGQSGRASRCVRLTAYSRPSKRCRTRNTLEKLPCPSSPTSLKSCLHSRQRGGVGQADQGGITGAPLCVRAVAVTIDIRSTRQPAGCRLLYPTTLSTCCPHPTCSASGAALPAVAPSTTHTPPRCRPPQRCCGSTEATAAA